MKLSDVVKIDNRFEKSVNLLLDLGNPARISTYIPTRSSVNILGEYLRNVQAHSAERATVLIGPYGKGKSHLLLVLLSVLSGKKAKETDELLAKIEAVSPSVGSLCKDIYDESRPMLPVILNAGNGSLSDAFLKSLMYALKKEGLQEISPDSYYSEALKTIERWKGKYPATYAGMTEAVRDEGIGKFTERLASMDPGALESFKKIYPELTAGGTFSPLIADEVIDIYRSVTRILCESYGYRGIHIIFDEFSKYIEGHPADTFSADMKTLQDMCELANSSKEEQIHLTAVAHKAIKAYGNRLPKEILNAYRGVEGRIKEVNFLVSSQNNYELIANAIIKADGFKEFIRSDELFAAVSDESYKTSVFKSLFRKEDYDKIVCEGCYPLSPVSSMLLLNLCEKVAQNERTVFTFLTDRSSGLSGFISETEGMDYADADRIYDYFANTFREEADGAVHDEWLKAEYALEKTEDKNCRKLLKALAVIRMINRQDEFPASANNLGLASGLAEEEELQKAIDVLQAEELIIYRPRNAAYEFRKSIGVDVDKVVRDTIATKFASANITEQLNEILAEKYTLPKKHNQDKFITRYFAHRFLSAESFAALEQYGYLTLDNHPDGAVLLITGDIDEEAVIKKTQALGDGRIVVILPRKECTVIDKIKYLLAVRHLRNDKEFVEDNAVLKRELDDTEQDLSKEINLWIKDAYFGNDQVITSAGKVPVGQFGLNRIVSDLCDRIYSATPVINNELINRHEISPQNIKARNTIIEDLISGCNYDKYATGTGPADTMGRATLIAAAEDEGVENARRIIKDFVVSCEGQKVCFKELFDRLMAPPVGMRKGVIPIYLTECLADLEDMPVVYAGTRELQLSPETINNLTADPGTYYLYVEKETAQKEEYLLAMEKLYEDFANKCRDIDKKNRLARLACMIQAWYRGLPQTSKTFMLPDDEKMNMKKIAAYRKLFMGVSINPREVLFDLIPRAFGTEEYDVAAKKAARAKKAIDEHIHHMKKSVEDAIRETLDFGSSDLKMSLKEWYANLPSASKEAVYDGEAQAFLTVIRSLNTTDNDEICDAVSRAVTGLFIEDYRDDTMGLFDKNLKAIQGEVGKKTQTRQENGKRISIEADGKIASFAYSFDPDSVSSTGSFYANALEEMNEEFPLSNEERVGILMEMVKRYINADLS